MEANILLGALAQGLLWSVMAIGIYITYRVLDISDLTAEGCFTLGASVVANCVTREAAGGFMSLFVNPYAATLLAIFAGMLAGIVTGFLHTRIKIPPLLSGILTMTALYSINLRIMGKANVTLVDKDLEPISILTPLMDMGFTKNQAATTIGLIVVVLIIALLWWFFNTEIGYAVRATGNNRNMVRALGVNTDNMIILGLIMGNGLIGLASALVGQYNGFSDISMGTGTIVIGLSSVIIGEIVFCYLFELILKKRSIFLSLISVVLGSVLYRFIIAWVLDKGLNSSDLKLFSSLILALFLAIPLIESNLKSSFSSKKGKIKTP